MQKATPRHYYKISEKSFYMIKDGIKCVDARLCDEKGQNIKKGDQLIFLKEPDLINGIRTRVVEIVQFKNFNELAVAINPVIFGLPGMPASEIAEFYNKFHLRSNVEKYGVIAIEFELIEEN